MGVGAFRVAQVGGNDDASGGVADLADRDREAAACRLVNADRLTAERIIGSQRTTIERLRAALFAVTGKDEL